VISLASYLKQKRKVKGSGPSVSNTISGQVRGKKKTEEVERDRSSRARQIRKEKTQKMNERGAAVKPI